MSETTKPAASRTTWRSVRSVPSRLYVLVIVLLEREMHSPPDRVVRAGNAVTWDRVGAPVALPPGVHPGRKDGRGQLAGGIIALSNHLLSASESRVEQASSVEEALLQRLRLILQADRPIRGIVFPRPLHISRVQNAVHRRVERGEEPRDERPRIGHGRGARPIQRVVRER